MPFPAPTSKIATLKHCKSKLENVGLFRIKSDMQSIKCKSNNISVTDMVLIRYINL